MSKVSPDKMMKSIAPAVHLVKLLAHPVRLYIVTELAQGDECSVGYFVSKLNTDFPVVSKHLAILKEAGIVETVRDGQWIYYRLTLPNIINFIDGLQKLSEQISK